MLIKDLFKKIIATFARLKYLVMVASILGIISLYLVKDSRVNAAPMEQTITDVDGDGIVNLADARILAPPQTVSCPVCVDVNGDKSIDQKDVDLVQTRIDNSRSYKRKFDINNDKNVNADDIGVVKNYIGQTVGDSLFGLNNSSELTAGFLANSIIIKFKAGVTKEQKESLYKKYDLKPRAEFTKIDAVELVTNQNNVAQLQKQIKNETIVNKAFKNMLFELKTDDPNYPEQWAIGRINLPPAWYIGITGKSSVKVAIIDSGADYAHQDLGNLSQTYRYDASESWDPGDPSSCPPWEFECQNLTDYAGHGTYIAGIIGATANNNKAIAGVNWNVEIIPIKACAPNEFNPTEVLCPTSFVIRSFEYLQNINVISGLDVVNLSIGVPDIYNELTEALNYYLDVYEYFGVHVIAAAGQGNSNSCEWPASRASVICVAATDSTANDAWASCSDGRVDSDISAPGVDIVSTVPADSDIFGPNSSGVAYINCGTSMATAYISGLVALCKTVEPINPRGHLGCENFNSFDYASNRRINAWPYLWFRNCKIFDNDDNNIVDVFDIQPIAFGLYDGVYSQRADVWPAGGDGIIDGHDLYTMVNGHFWDECQ